MISPLPLAVFGWMEILAILAIVILLFGASRLPSIGRGLGEGIREFKKSLTGSPDEDSGEGTPPRRIQGGDDEPRP